MTIKIESNVETHLVMRLAEGFQENTVKSEYLSPSDLDWADDLSASLSDDARAKLDRYIGDKALTKFLFQEISRDIDRMPARKPLKIGEPISQLGFMNNVISYAKDLISILKSIPIRYRLTVELPQAFSKDIIQKVPSTLNLNNDILIAKGNFLPEPFPVVSAYPTLNMNLFDEWWEEEEVEREPKSDKLYFSMTLSGYAYSASSSSLGRILEDNLRAFYGAALAIGLTSQGFLGPKEKTPHITVHVEHTREIIETEVLEQEFYDTAGFSSTEAFAGRKIAEIGVRYTSALKKIATIFENNVECRRLFSACLWFYRAKTNRRPLDALLQATIAIEVMLGDRKAAEGVGLTNLLGNRCSFLLGTTARGREQIMNDFRAVYGLRSRIVHEGIHTVETGDRGTVELATALCAKIIRRELVVHATAEGI